MSPTTLVHETYTNPGPQQIGATPDRVRSLAHASRATRTLLIEDLRSRRVSRYNAFPGTTTRRHQ